MGRFSVFRCWFSLAQTVKCGLHYICIYVTAQAEKMHPVWKETKGEAGTVLAMYNQL